MVKLRELIQNTSHRKPEEEHWNSLCWKNLSEDLSDQMLDHRLPTGQHIAVRLQWSMGNTLNAHMELKCGIRGNNDPQIWWK